MQKKKIVVVGRTRIKVLWPKSRMSCVVVGPRKREMKDDDDAASIILIFNVHDDTLANSKV